MIYDLIIVGGGLGGASLAAALATKGARVLVLEREQAFRDRVRGEGLLPWGVAEARALGIYDLLMQTCGHEVRWWSWGPEDRRDLVETTPHRAGSLNFYHPEMQQALLAHAEAAGAEVRRGTAVVGVVPGASARVVARGAAGDEMLRARLVVGADGRQAQTRAWGGFTVRRDRERLMIAGALLEGLDAPEDAVQHVWNPPLGHALVFPLGRGRFRCYYGAPTNGVRRVLSGAAHLADFTAACVEAGAPEAWYAGATLAGPLASFQGADTWVERPYRDGVALIGDAAAASDPNYGSGLALTLRDVRVLRDQLLASEDWDAAARAYAAEHDRSYGALHRIEDWTTELYFAHGPEADARRARALARMAGEPDRRLDIIGLGPDGPSDEEARRRFFGED